MGTEQGQNSVLRLPPYFSTDGSISLPHPTPSKRTLIFIYTKVLPRRYITLDVPAGNYKPLMAV